VIVPEAYIIPPEWDVIINRLAYHGIQFKTLGKPQKISIESYRFTAIEYGRASYEGRTQVTPTFKTIREQREFPAGSVVVPTDQQAVRLIVHMLEPGSPDSFLQWGFFNAIFEMKEYFETYQMEEYARKMIDETPGMKEEFDQWKTANPDAVQNQWAQLEWFFLRSPWADQRRNVYPVGRIIESDQMRKVGQLDE
jgi:hypothetical protein